MGPTASGKTDLAVALAERLPVDIISVDSAMVYRGLDIGTAKPPPEVLARAPHRLIDICDPREAYSAGRFRADALREIGQAFDRGRVPLLVGGTGLYFRALQNGLASLPEADPGVREALDREARQVGWAEMHRRLAAVDPVTAARIHENDPQRIQRALEVHRLTGRPLSEFFNSARGAPLPYPVIKLGVAPADRASIGRRAEQRYRAMLERGLLEEIRGLFARGDLHPALPSMRLVGYRQGWRHLAGEIGYEDMARQAIVATRQLAKRQLTWLRAERDLVWFDATSGELLDRAMNWLLRNATIPGRV